MAGKKSRRRNTGIIYRECNDNLLLYQYIRKLAPGVQVMLVPNNNPYLLTLPTLIAATLTPSPTTTP